MYPYYTHVSPEDDGHFWFYNAMHFPEPMSAFDVITAEAPYAALGAFNTRIHVLPTVKGVDHRIINGRVYISAIGVDDADEISARLKKFQERGPYYYSNWNKLYVQWREKIVRLIEELDTLTIPQLPEYEDISITHQGRGIASNHDLKVAYNRCIEGYFQMWQYHFEFLTLGYGAYLTFSEFCKRAFPEITEQTIARMVAGVDVLMFRPDDELKKLARIAVDLGIDHLFVDGKSPDQLLKSIRASGQKGKAWLDALDAAKDPWFNVSSGDGFYHHHRAWKDDLSIPFSVLPRYIQQLKNGESLDRPMDRLRAERDQIVADYRSLLERDSDQAAFDQVLNLARTVFPYVEDHKFYCEHWYTSIFFNKIREFGVLLAQQHYLEDAEDIFHLHYTEVAVALADMNLNWAAGTRGKGTVHWPSLVKSRKEALAKLAAWQAPPVLGSVPNNISDPMLQMLWGVTQERVEEWSKPKDHTDSDDVLKGLAASPGVVEGVAFVAKSVADMARIPQDSILVCPVTAPSWVPIFSKLSAVVADIGGTMSHAAIVAREYGLPAVVGVSSGTDMIRNGDYLHVNGNTGVVTILKRAEQVA